VRVIRYRNPADALNAWGKRQRAVEAYNERIRLEKVRKIKAEIEQLERQGTMGDDFAIATEEYLDDLETELGERRRTFRRRRPNDTDLGFFNDAVQQHGPETELVVDGVRYRQSG